MSNPTLAAKLDLNARP